MPRNIVVLSSYKLGPSAVNSSVPQPFILNVNDILGQIVRVSNNQQRWGSVLKPAFKQAGLYKAQVFESPNQIQTLIDNTQPGADAALTVSAAGTTQAAATLLPRFYNRITTVATGVNDGVRLPQALPGAIEVVEHAGVGTLRVYPAVSTTGVYAFTVTPANAGLGSTFTNNGQTFTVVAAITAISGATVLYATGTGAPAASGTLTKASGSGSSTIAFSSAVAVSSIDSLANNASANYVNPGTIVTFSCLTPGNWKSMVW